MQLRWMRLPLAALAAAASLSGCRGGPPRYWNLPNFDLTSVTARGQGRLNREALSGRVWVADFFFTRCQGPCPLLTAAMARLQKTLPPEAGLLSFTVDPDADTPEALREYARRFEADPKRWLFVTGEKKALYSLLREGFKLAAQEDPHAPAGLRVSHSTKFALIDGAGTLRGFYDGDDPEALERLNADARRLVETAK